MLYHEQLTKLNRLYYDVEMATEWLEWFEQIDDRKRVAMQREHIDYLWRSIQELEGRMV